MAPSGSAQLTIQQADREVSISCEEDHDQG
jgi:hypothetical protein